MPITFASYIARCSDSGIPTSYIAAPWIAASQPSIPARIASVSDRSPETSSQPSSLSGCPFSGLRTRARTSSPRCLSRRTTWPPMNPVPPVTNTFIARKPIHARTTVFSTEPADGRLHLS